MIKRNFLNVSAVLAATFLAACTTETTQSPSSSAADNRAWGDTYLYAEALYGEPVFQRDVKSFSQTVSLHLDKPKASHLFSAMDTTLPASLNGKGKEALADLAAKADDDKDLVVVMLTTHGSPDILAYKAPNEDPFGISPAALENRLSALSADQQLIILQACYSGSFIDDLAAPNRIILTAAAADRSSFGCEPNNKNTWYIEAFNDALAQGGSLKDIATRAHALVRAREKAQGIPPERYSNPQISVGSKMKDIWNG